MNETRINEEAKAAFLARRRDTAPEPRQYELSAGEMVTRAELEALEKSRSTPAPAPHLRPGGAIEREVHEDVERRKEERRRFVAQRLREQEQRPVRDFRRAR